MKKKNTQRLGLTSFNDAPAFNKKKHIYTKDGSHYESVTTFVKSFFEPFDAKNISKWIAKKRRLNGEKITAAQVRKEWRATADKGTETHQQIEDFLTQGIPALDGKACSAIGFLKDYFPKLWEYQFVPELRIWSDTHQLCGTTDLVLFKEPNNLILIDWKTSKTIVKTSKKKGLLPPTSDIDDCNYNHYMLQLSTYAYLLEKEFGFTIDKLFLVHLPKDNVYIEYDVPYQREIVEEMLEWRNKNKNKQ